MSIAELLRQEEIPNALLARIYNRSTTGINNRGEAVQAHINFSKLLIKLAKFTSLIIDPAASAVMDKKFEWAFDKWERHNDETAFYEFIDLAFEVESVVEIQKELTNDNIIKLAKSGFSNFLRFQKFKIIKEDDGRGSLACKLLGLDEHPMFDTELKGRRKLRKAAKQAVAKLNIKLGLIGSIKDGVGKYERCTPYQVGMRNEQKVGWRNFAQNKVMVKNGVAISMLNIMDGAQKKLFDEKYVMVKGLEEFSKKSGMDWVFITLTPPPSFHPNPANGNSSWDGISFANDAMTWLHKNYRSVLLSLRKMEILPAGLWVTEPQKDSTTHIHLLMFANPSDMQTIEDEFRKVDGWNCDAGCKWERNNRLASAASYVFKYIAKSLACYSELSGEQAEVDAWRSTWAIRGTGFFGLAPIGLWRALRSLKNPQMTWGPKLNSAWRAARGNNACDFIGITGGLNLKTNDRPVGVREIKDNGSSKKTLVFREAERSTFYSRDKWTREEVKREGVSRNSAQDRLATERHDCFMQDPRYYALHHAFVTKKHELEKFGLALAQHKKEVDSLNLEHLFKVIQEIQNPENLKAKTTPFSTASPPILTESAHATR